MTQPRLMQTFVEHVEAVEARQQADYADADRWQMIWAVEHPWASMAYRVLGSMILAAGVAGIVGLTYKVVRWVLFWWWLS